MSYTANPEATTAMVSICDFSDWQEITAAQAATLAGAGVIHRRTDMDDYDDCLPSYVADDDEAFNVALKALEAQ